MGGGAAGAAGQAAGDVSPSQLHGPSIFPAHQAQSPGVGHAVRRHLVPDPQGGGGRGRVSTVAE